MLSKASVVMLPVTLLLYCWWRRDRISWNDLARLAPHLAIALVLGLAAMHFQSAHAPVDPAVDSRGPITRLVGAETAAVFYLGKVFCPVALTPIYPRWALDKSWPFALLSGTFLAAALWLMCARRSGGALGKLEAFRPRSRNFPAGCALPLRVPPQRLGPACALGLRLLPAQPSSRARLRKDDVHEHQLGRGSLRLSADDRHDRAVRAWGGGVPSAASRLPAAVSQFCGDRSLRPSGVRESALRGALGRRRSSVVVHDRSQSRRLDGPVQPGG